MGINPSTTIQPFTSIDDGWSFNYMYNGDRATQVAAGITAVTAVIGVIVGGGYLGAGAIAVASIIVSLYIKQVYYTTSQFSKRNSPTCEMKNIITFYQDSTRVTVIGTETRYWAPSRCS